MASKKNWNLYAGTDEYSTDTYLQFKNEAVMTKYESENRSKDVVKSLIIVSLITYVFTAILNISYFTIIEFPT